MKSETAPISDAEGSFFAFDTTLVLFFLAVDLGRSVFSPDLGSMLTAGTLLTVAAAPDLMWEKDLRGFWGWFGARMLIAGFGLLAGVLLGGAIGTLLPESVRFVPITLLILAAFLSFSLQFYAILRVRLAR
jgi:hypothetical protein